MAKIELWLYLIYLAKNRWEHLTDKDLNTPHIQRRAHLKAGHRLKVVYEGRGQKYRPFSGKSLKLAYNTL